jgi:hypothetical protein
MKQVLAAGSTIRYGGFPYRIATDIVVDGVPPIGAIAETAQSTADHVKLNSALMQSDKYEEKKDCANETEQRSLKPSKVELCQSSFCDASPTPARLPSRFQIGDFVAVGSMVVKSIGFSAGKVRYDLHSKELGGTLLNVDSAFVCPAPSAPASKPDAAR